MTTTANFEERILRKDEIILNLRVLGYTYKQIQERLGVSSKTISKVIKEYNDWKKHDEEVKRNKCDLHTSDLLKPINLSADIFEGQERYYKSLVKDTKPSNLIPIEWLV